MEYGEQEKAGRRRLDPGEEGKAGVPGLDMWEQK